MRRVARHGSNPFQNEVLTSKNEFRRRRHIIPDVRLVGSQIKIQDPGQMLQVLLHSD